MTAEPSLPIHELQTALEGSAETTKRDWWERYLRGAARFRGVPTPAIRTLSTGWWERHAGDGLPADEQLEVCLRLLRCPMTEDKLAGMLLLGERLIPAGVIDCRVASGRFSELYRDGHLADWNAVDWFCVRVLGPLIERGGEPCARSVADWVGSDRLWQRRSALVGFVTLAPLGAYAELIIGTAERLVRDPERFAQTGVAWVVRELGRSRPDLTEPFLERHADVMSTEARRQARGRRR